MPGELLLIAILIVALVALELLRRALHIEPPSLPSAGSLAVASALFALLAFGIWYVTVYDTAGGRCSRGDLGACLVLEAQRQQQR